MSFLRLKAIPASLAASVALSFSPLASPAASAQSEVSSEERIAALEARLQELESRLSDTEQETKEVKVLAASGAAGASRASAAAGQGSAAWDILTDSAWRRLRWTDEKQWAGIRKGVSEERVVQLLGDPPRTVKSLKPRVDEVYYYETGLRDKDNSLRGRVTFKDGKVIAFEKPEF